MHPSNVSVIPRLNSAHHMPSYFYLLVAHLEGQEVYNCYG